MKKTFLTAALALSIGATGAAVGTQQANAVDEPINKVELAQLALNNDSSLNEHAIEPGAYDYEFSLNGVNFHFWSNGSVFGWSYNANGQADTANGSSIAAPTQFSDMSYFASTQTEQNGASSVQQGPSYSPAPQSAPTYNTSSTSANSITLANGNTPGYYGNRAAQDLAQRTGVSADVWARIIARESGGQLNARNASGASGLLQTMPGWGPTNTYEQQIQAAERAYRAQGLSAWGF
ncbi:transglycosylase SLT domain-containing protein [Staphylococcus lutrae]|uniref:Probable transglycosylase IsaA n=1 Tax=Staphylococcus lutrae TaxID=155085 RepID=A0AAC9RS06_9STAP|nr:transglycosylase SLT domain-containing protein [Staphylococcus lutrae]ARJ50614.1 transglycosylase [Staphylococcus lutrae]PNZ38801.1 transglycosylase [Staphylococcus lutrae]